MTYTRGVMPKYRPHGVFQEKAPEPSEEEIAAMCEQIQATWSEAERESRRWWTVERVEHKGKSKKYTGQDAPLDWSLKRSNVADIPAYETPVIPVAELEAA